MQILHKLLLNIKFIYPRCSSRDTEKIWFFAHMDFLHQNDLSECHSCTDRQIE